MLALRPFSYSQVQLLVVLHREISPSAAEHGPRTSRVRVDNSPALRHSSTCVGSRMAQGAFGQCIGVHDELRQVETSRALLFVFIAHCDRGTVHVSPTTMRTVSHIIHKSVLQHLPFSCTYLLVCPLTQPATIYHSNTTTVDESAL